MKHPNENCLIGMEKPRVLQSTSDKEAGMRYPSPYCKSGSDMMFLQRDFVLEVSLF